MKEGDNLHKPIQFAYIRIRTVHDGDFDRVYNVLRKTLCRKEDDRDTIDILVG
jgi:hypothetical protein